MERMCHEERQLREENKRLQETLNLEKERSEQLCPSCYELKIKICDKIMLADGSHLKHEVCRALSESESSLDGSLMDWDTHSASGYDYLRDTHPTRSRDLSRPNLSSPHSNMLTQSSSFSNQNTTTITAASQLLQNQPQPTAQMVQPTSPSPKTVFRNNPTTVNKSASSIQPPPPTER